MTKDEALKLALEILNAAYVPADLDKQREKAITAIKQALAAQPAPVQKLGQVTAHGIKEKT